MNNTKTFARNLATAATLAALGLMPLAAYAQNPVPVLSSIAPTTVPQGSSQFTLVLNGTGFTSSSVVYFNGSPRSTSFNSSTQISATIPASDVSVAGTGMVSVFNPLPGGGFSNGLVLTITGNNPVPAITSIVPSSKIAGDAGFTMTVNGTNFIPSSVVRFDGSSRLTTYISSTQLTASIPATDIVSPGTDAVTVFNPTPGGGTSNALTFTTLAAPAGAPLVSSISPSSVVVGSGQFTLTVSGSGFDSNTVVNVNGSPRLTVYLSPSMITATIPMSDVALVGVRSITAVDPERGTSNSLALIVTAVPGLPDTGIGPSEQSGGAAALGLAGLGSLLLILAWNARKRLL